MVLFTHFYEPPKSLDHNLLSSLVLKQQRCIIDFRTATDFSNWHLPGSVNICLESLDSHTQKPFSEPSVLEAQWLELEGLFSDSSVISKLRQHHVLAICYNGDTARVGSSVLRARGIEADCLRGGYQALRDHRLWNGTNVHSDISICRCGSDFAIANQSTRSETVGSG